MCILIFLFDVGKGSSPESKSTQVLPITTHTKKIILNIFGIYSEYIFYYSRVDASGCTYLRYQALLDHVATDLALENCLSTLQFEKVGLSSDFHFLDTPGFLRNSYHNNKPLTHHLCCW